MDKYTLLLKLEEDLKIEKEKLYQDIDKVWENKEISDYIKQTAISKLLYDLSLLKLQLETLRQIIY